MNKESKNNIQRRSFFKRIGFGLTGTAILSSLPYKVFSKTDKERKKVKVNIHSSAIKRNK
jgi:hypothetical protein